MKILTIQDVKCPGCGRINTKYHAKNLCKACYMREYRAKSNRTKPVNKSLDGVTK